MIEEVVLIVSVEERLDSNWTLDSSVWNLLSGIRKKFWTTVFFTSNTIVISESSRNGF